MHYDHLSVLSLVAFLAGFAKVRHLGQVEDLLPSGLEEQEQEVVLEVLHPSMEAVEEEVVVEEASSRDGWLL